MQLRWNDLGKPRADKADGKSSTLFYMKDDAPTITFMQLEKPMPYCIIITE